MILFAASPFLSFTLQASHDCTSNEAGYYSFNTFPELKKQFFQQFTNEVHTEDDVHNYYKKLGVRATMQLLAVSP